MGINNIPLELRQLDQFVIWKADKKPRNPHNNTFASVSDPGTWGTFTEAIKAVKDYGGKGVGFVFTENDTYCGIDLDNAIDGNGDIDPEAQKIIERLDSYTEVSQSGRGIHIIVRGEKPGPECRKGNVEIYDRSRYLALTGDLWQDRAAINDRQDELNWLYDRTFGGVESESEPVEVGELVLDPFREPPKDELAELLEDKNFRRQWEHKSEAKNQSMSDYDYRLVLLAIEACKDDQSLADLIIAHRRKWGDKDDLKKALREDYIKGTIAKAKAEQTSGSGVLALLPFKVSKVLQYGFSNATISLVLDDDREINMGPTDRYASARFAHARLLEEQLGLPKKAYDKWRDITLALQPLMEKIETTSSAENMLATLHSYIGSRTSLPEVRSREDLHRLFDSHLHSIAYNPNNGMVFITIEDFIRYFRMKQGRNVNAQTVGYELTQPGVNFQKKELRKYIGKGKKGPQVTVWCSPLGFFPCDYDDENDNEEGQDAEDMLKQ
jgi:hypothetical protein